MQLVTDKLNNANQLMRVNWRDLDQRWASRYHEAMSNFSHAAFQPDKTYIFSYRVEKMHGHSPPHEFLGPSYASSYAAKARDSDSDKLKPGLHRDSLLLRQSRPDAEWIRWNSYRAMQNAPRRRSGEISMRRSATQTVI